MRKSLILVAAAFVAIVSLTCHQAEALMLAAPAGIQAAIKAANSTKTAGCAQRRVCSHGVCTMKRVCD
jgi:hypothetical protein